MFDTFKEVKSNKFINNLPELVENFGFISKSAYVDFKSSSDETINSVYFIVGNQVEVPELKNINIEKLKRKIDKDTNFLYLDYNAFELTDNDPFTTHQYIMDYCTHAEFAKEVFREHNMDLPEKIDKRFLLHLENLYKEKEKHGKESFYNELYENTFHRYVSLQSRILHHDREEQRKAQLELYGLIEKNTNKSFFSKRINKRSYDNFCDDEDILNYEGTLINHRIKAKFVKGLNEKLQDSNILCWCSPVQEQPTSIISESLGSIRSKEKDDDSIVTLRYDIHDANAITRMLVELAYPQIADRDITDILESSNYTLAIKESDLKTFYKLCNENDVNFGFDPERIYNRGYFGPINLIISKKDQETVNEIIDCIAKESEMHHIHNLGVPYSEKGGSFKLLNGSLDDFEGLSI